MGDLNARFRTLDRIAAPDVWMDVERRVGTPVTTSSLSPVAVGRAGAGRAGAKDRAPARLRLLLVAAALLVTAVVGIALVGGRPSPLPAAHNGEIVVAWEGDLYAVDRTTSERRALLECPLDTTSCQNIDYSVTWSPDGARLAYAITRFGTSVPNIPADPELGMWILDVDTGGVRRVDRCDLFSCESPWSIAWSPDGSRIAIAVAGDLDVIDPVTGVREGWIGSLGQIEGMSWAPDSSAVIISAREDGRSRLRTISLDLERQTSVLDATERGAMNPGWSPDGGRAAYLAYVPGPQPDPEGQGLIGQIWTVAIDGTDPTKLFEGADPCCRGAASWGGPVWSADGTMLAFVTANDNRLRLIGADGSNPIDLGPANGRTSPAWRPVP